MLYGYMDLPWHHEENLQKNIFSVQQNQKTQKFLMNCFAQQGKQKRSTEDIEQEELISFEGNT